MTAFRDDLDPSVYTMAIKAVVEDAHHDLVDPGVIIPSVVIPGPDDARFACLRFVDPYDDTFFNTLQLPYLEADLLLLIESIQDKGNRQVLLQLLELVQRYQHPPGFRLRFIGD